MAAVALPKIVAFGYTNYSIVNETKNGVTISHHKASCAFCKHAISERLGTTSNFTRHIQRKYAAR